MIARAENKKPYVYVYDEKGKKLFQMMGELQSFTSENVLIKRNSLIFVYNEKGKQMSYHKA